MSVNVLLFYLLYKIVYIFVNDDITVKLITYDGGKHRAY
jgi:hypothetical protein